MIKIQNKIRFSVLLTILLSLIIYKYSYLLHEKPIIQGDAKCIEKITNSLNLIKEKSPSYMIFVKDNIGIIKCVEKGSGVFVWEKPPILNLGRNTYEAGEEWLAGAIVHDSCHVTQYKSNKSFNGEEAEKECLNIQYDFLKKINAKNELLEGVKNALNTKYWEIPYEQRSW